MAWSAAKAAVSACNARSFTARGCPREAPTDEPDRVVGEQGVVAAGDATVVTDIVGGVGCAHPGDRAAHGNALVQRGEHTEAEAVPQGRLADQHDRERGPGESRSWLVSRRIASSWWFPMRCCFWFMN